MQEASFIKFARSHPHLSFFSQHASMNKILVEKYTLTLAPPAYIQAK